MPSSRQPSPLRQAVDPAAAGAIAADRVAVITGAASGIGRAAALELAQYVYILILHRSSLSISV